MYGLQKWAWAAVFAVAATAPAAAQQTGGINSGGRTSSFSGGQGGSQLGSSQLGSSQLGSSQLGSQLGGQLGSSFGGSNGSNGGFGGSNGGIGGSNGNGFSNTTQTMPTLMTNSSSLQKSNVFSGYYASPMLASGSTSSASFGSPLYGTSSGGTSGGRGSTVGSTSSYGGGGLGGAGRSGLGGGLGNSNSANQSGIVVPIQTQLAYTAVILPGPTVPTAPVAVSRIQTEIRGVLDRSTMISNAKDVQISVDRFNNVILRGTVANRDEAAFIEGMVRITPGVAGIINELTPDLRTGSK
jgi:hypothetical protein